jgi:hypothetical protein
MNISGRLTIVVATEQEFNDVLAKIQSEPKFSNIVIDADTKSISFDLDTTE